MKFPLVRELAVEGIPVAVTCRVMGFSKQAYFKWLRDPISTRDWENAHLTNAAVDAHHDDPTFGYRFLADELERQGLKVSENRVWRLCRDQRLWSNHAKKRGLNRRPGPPVHDDLVQRDLSASRANELWICDITEHPTSEGKLYACIIQDVFSKRIVGYSIDSRMPAELAVKALDHAVALRGRHATTVHTDRGSQFRANKFVARLKRYGLQGSMGRVGACGDNAAMESFNSLLQKNVLDQQRWATRDELRLAIARWIESSYNRRRRQRELGKLTPVEFETVYSVANAA